MITNNISIIYASSSGNTLFVSEFVAGKLDEQGFTTDLINADIFDPMDLNKMDHVLFATSTWEHGEIHPFFHNTIKRLDQIVLQGRKVAFIGTGDRRYEPILFCGGMEILRKKVLSRGADEILSPLRLDGDPRPNADSTVSKWVDKLLTVLEA